MELAHYTLMTVKEVRLEIYIYNHKKFQMPIPNKMTTENNADTHTLLLALAYAAWVLVQFHSQAPISRKSAV